MRAVIIANNSQLTNAYRAVALLGSFISEKSGHTTAFINHQCLDTNKWNTSSSSMQGSHESNLYSALDQLRMQSMTPREFSSYAMHIGKGFRCYNMDSDKIPENDFIESANDIYRTVAEEIVFIVLSEEEARSSYQNIIRAADLYLFMTDQYMENIKQVLANAKDIDFKEGVRKATIVYDYNPQISSKEELFAALSGSHNTVFPIEYNPQVHRSFNKGDLQILATNIVLKHGLLVSVNKDLGKIEQLLEPEREKKGPVDKFFGFFGKRGKRE